MSRRALAALLLAVVPMGVVGCGEGGARGGASFGGGGDASITTDGTDTTADPSGTAASSEGDGPADTGVVEVDDATIAASDFPAALMCLTAGSATVEVRNTGTSTWTRAGGYRLGAVDDADPLAPTRIDLADADAIAPGQTHVFELPLSAPEIQAAVTSDWQMVREQVHWFGDGTVGEVQVDCAPPQLDLDTVEIIASPDVRGFAITSELTSIEFRPGIFRIDHTLRGTWPPILIDPNDGTEQEATVWIFFRIDGQWYGTGGERLRPNQNEKELAAPSVIGPDWFYNPDVWGPMAGYVPQPGEYVGFMIVAGSTRVDDNVIVQERTGAVLVPFPTDGVEAIFPPFAWQESP